MNINNSDEASNESVQPAVPESLLKDRIVPGLNIDKGIKRFIGDEEVYLHVLRTFSVNTRSILVSLDIAIKEKSTDYEIKIHSLRGSSASICADPLAEMAKELELAAKAEDWEYISEHNKHLNKAAVELISGLDKLFIEADQQCQKQKKDKPDPNALKRLQTACDNYDMDGVDAVMEEITIYSYVSDDGLVDWLSENIELMNFSEIVERLSAQ